MTAHKQALAALKDAKETARLAQKWVLDHGTIEAAARRMEIVEKTIDAAITALESAAPVVGDREDNAHLVRVIDKLIENGKKEITHLEIMADLQRCNVYPDDIKSLYAPAASFVISNFHYLEAAVDLIPYLPSIRRALATPPAAPSEVERAAESGAVLKWFERVLKTNPCVNGDEKEADFVRRALTAPAAKEGEWMPIETAPDGKNILVAVKVTGADEKYFEPEIAYRNGNYWFKEPAERMFCHPHLWREIPAVKAALADKGA